MRRGGLTRTLDAPIRLPLTTPVSNAFLDIIALVDASKGRFCRLHLSEQRLLALLMASMARSDFQSDGYTIQGLEMLRPADALETIRSSLSRGFEGSSADRALVRACKVFGKSS